MSAALVVLAIFNAILAYLLRELHRELRYHKTCIDHVFQVAFAPRAPGQAAPQMPAPRTAFTLPPPAPPPEEEPSPYALSSLPDELAAALEIEERETFGASSRTTFATTSQDDHELALEDAYTSDLAKRIRAYAGDEG